MAKPRIRESDLYPPLKRFLEAQGYAVKGEVNDCDAVAVRGGEEPVVVELKVSPESKGAHAGDGAVRAAPARCMSAWRTGVPCWRGTVAGR